MFASNLIKMFIQMMIMKQSKDTLINMYIKETDPLAHPLQFCKHFCSKEERLKDELQFPIFTHAFAHSGGAVVSTVVPQQDKPWVGPPDWVWNLYVNFCVLSLCMLGFPPGAPGSSNSKLKLTDESKL